MSNDMNRPWHIKARPQQLPPAGDWRVWLVTAGRGWGKTRAGAEWIAEQAATQPNTEWAVVAPTWRDCRKICFEGCSGVLQALLPDELDSMTLSDLRIRLSNGSRIYGYSADRPDRLRGTTVSGAWWDELIPYGQIDPVWETLAGVPRVVITTTPPERPIPLVTELLNRTDGSVVHVNGNRR